MFVALILDARARVGASEGSWRLMAENSPQASQYYNRQEKRNTPGMPGRASRSRQLAAAESLQ
jgi:hypothetical protein